MERMKIAALFADQDTLGGQEVTVCGWAKTIRDMKTRDFHTFHIFSPFPV